MMNFIEVYLKPFFLTVKFIWTESKKAGLIVLLLYAMILSAIVSIFFFLFDISNTAPEIEPRDECEELCLGDDGFVYNPNNRGDCRCIVSNLNERE